MDLRLYDEYEGKLTTGGPYGEHQPKHAANTVSAEPEWLSSFRKYKAIYLISIPGILYFLVFKYVPLFGAMAFQEYNLFKGIWESPWVGLDQFYRMFQYEEFLRIFWNTLLIGMYSIVFAFPVPILLALLLNEIRLVLYKRVARRSFTCPTFCPGSLSGIAVGILSPTTGIINQILMWVGLEPIYFLGEESYIRAF